jgi:DNA-directed RNA polymerase subunit K/omega
MPQGKDKIGGAKSPKAQSKVKVSNDSDNESDNESVAEVENNKYNNNYDATAHNNGDDDDALLDGDMESAEWDGDEEENAEEEEEEADDDVADDDVDMGEGGDAADDDCAYNVTRKQRGNKKLGAVIDKEDDDDDEGADGNVDENELNEDLYVKPEDRRSGPNLMLYEKVRLLGDRTAQLAQGAKPMIKGVQGMDPRVVAQLELESKMIPIKIIRPLPNGKKEIWSLNELQLKKKYIVYGFTGGTVDKQGVAKIVGEYKKGGNMIGYSHLTSSISTMMPEQVETQVTASKVRSKKSGSEQKEVGSKKTKSKKKA